MQTQFLMQQKNGALETLTLIMKPPPAARRARAAARAAGAAGGAPLDRASPLCRFLISELSLWIHVSTLYRAFFHTKVWVHNTVIQWILTSGKEAILGFGH